MPVNELSEEERKAELLAEADRILGKRNIKPLEGGSSVLAEWQRQRRRRLKAERRKLRKAGIKLPGDFGR